MTCKVICMTVVLSGAAGVVGRRQQQVCMFMNVYKNHINSIFIVKNKTNTQNNMKSSDSLVFHSI